MWLWRECCLPVSLSRGKGPASAAFTLVLPQIQLDANGPAGIQRLWARVGRTMARQTEQRPATDAGRPDFGEVVERHSDLVYNVALRMMGRPEDAEEVAQDAFLSAYRAYDRFRGDSKVTTWLYRITVNAALQRLRREKRARELTRTGLDDVEIPDWSGAPDRFASNSELGDRLRDGIASLPEDFRTAVVLRDVEGLSNAEAAEAVGITVASFKSRLHRGRVLLRKHLEEYVTSIRA